MTQGVITAKLTRCFRSTDEEVVVRGRAWYPEALDRMEWLAQETGYLTEQAVAVMAITSRAAQLSSNLNWTEAALRSGGEEPVGRFPNQMTPAVRKVLADPSNILSAISGPKVESFYRAIMGDEDAVVLDRWALLAAGHTERAPDPGPKRRVIERAYRRAAELCNIAPRNFQAAIWISVRGQHLANIV